VFYGNLVVGHSGGADSTCLLYLLHSWILQNKKNQRDYPSAVLSVIVDHSLQQGSASTAEQCRQFCEKLGISSQVIRIPWAENGFPERPEPGKAFETIARHARHQILFEGMRASGANVLATGHHADDNLETVVMRMLAAPVEAFNVTPMRPIRRWGLSYGMPGMQSWMIKPLLTIPKVKQLLFFMTI
jgi:tRNA(Ile)-lysidine synthase